MFSPQGDGKKRNQGLHDADDRYTWYSTDANNNGFAGYPNEGNTCYGHKSAKAGTWCNTQAYVKRVNAQGWCGAKDWRLPGIHELESLADFSIARPAPTIDAKYFPDAVATMHWSSSSYARHSNYAWLVNFYDGDSSGHYGYRKGGKAVRLVRGGQ